MFGSSSLLPPLVGRDGRLVCESVGKADLLSYHFGSHISSEICCHVRVITLQKLIIIIIIIIIKKGLQCKAERE